MMNSDEKSKVRKQILSVRNHLSEEEREKADFLITEKVLGHNWFQMAEHLLVYINVGSEVSTEIIIKEALRLGKHVYAPKVEGDCMSFFEFRSPESLIPGFHKIPEPVSGLPEFCYPGGFSQSALMLMPGVVFDRRGNRIGYGKGFYDRYLQDKCSLHTMALAYECQVVDCFAAEEHDIKPNVIITEACKKGGFQ